VHVAPPPTLGISSHLQMIGSEKQRLEKFSHLSTFSKFHAGAASAMVIQRVWRSHISRLIQSDLQHLQRLVLLERSILTVQRCWRGHLGRFEASGLLGVMKHDRKIEELNASAVAVQAWYKTNLRRSLEEKARRDLEKLLHQQNLEAISVALLRHEGALVLQKTARCTAANHRYRQQLLQSISYEAVVRSRNAAWIKLKGFYLIICAKGVAAQKRKQRQLIMLKNDPDKASRVISRAIRRRGGQLMRLQWLTVERFALATLRLQQKRKGASFGAPKMEHCSDKSTVDEGNINAALSADVLEDALMQMESTLRSQDDERRASSPISSSFVGPFHDAHAAMANAVSELSIKSDSNAPLRPLTDSTTSKFLPAPNSQLKAEKTAVVSASNSRNSSASKHALSGPSVLGASKSLRAAPTKPKAVGSSVMQGPLPVGSVVFSLRQLSDKIPLANRSKPVSRVSLTKKTAGEHRSAFAQVSELFSSSPSRSSSSAVALKEAEEARQSALIDVNTRHSDSSAAHAALQKGGRGLEDDSDEWESSGQLPIGVLEALMVRPTRAVEQDKRLLKLALDTENKCVKILLIVAFFI